MRAKHTFAGLFALAGLLLSSGPTNASPRAAKSRTTDEARHASRISVQIYRNFLVVAEGQIGGVPGPANFLVDTGATPSIVNSKVATQLGLATKPSFSIALGTRASAQMATLPEIDFGPIHATALPVLVADLSNFETDFGVAIAGIIGMDVLSKSDFTLDYDARRIEFGDVSREGIPIDYDAREGIAVASMKIGNKTLRMLVDTGSEFVVLLGGNFGEVGGLGLRNTSQSGASLAERKIRIQKFSASGIGLGDRKFDSDSVYFVPGKTDPAFDGLLGVRALGIRKLSYDRACETLYLE
jgi:predicted aspartyl protease